MTTLLTVLPTAAPTTRFVGVPDIKWGEVAAADLIAFCQGRLARYKMPKSVVFVGELPP